MKRMGWFDVIMACAVVLTAGLAGAGDKAPAVAKAAPPGVNRTPEGPKFPVCWKYTFSPLPELAVNKDVEITITIAAPLFDMKVVEIVPETSEDLKLVSETSWKGALKKGEAHVVKFTVRPTKTGFNGLYGVTVKAPGFYDELAAYVIAQQEGPYADPNAKTTLLDMIQGMRNEQPLAQEWFGTGLELGGKGGS